LKSIPKRLAATSVIALVAIAAAVAPASANPGPLGAERAAEAATAAALGLGSGEALQARSVVVDADGTRHVRYDRTLDGLAVVGGDLVVEKSASGSVRATRGQAAKGLGTVAKKVSVSSAAAIATARKQTAYTPTATTATQVIWAGDGTARIAWDVRTVGTRADQTPSRQHVYVDARTGAARQLSFATDDPWKGIAKGNVERRTVKTADGQNMNVWMIFPPGFDAKKKYPALLYCQGGPQSALSQFFSYRWNMQLMAAKGYIVVAPCRRGMPGSGQAWNDAISGDWGGGAMQDLLAASDYAAKEPYVDAARMGAVGASFGGYSVYWLAGNHQKRFKVFIAHDGIFNLESFYGETEELWFVHNDLEGAYWKTPKPKSYTQFSPHLYVQNWDTPILIVHNELDFRIPVTQGIQAFTAAQLRGIPSRFLYFPDEGHWMQKAQNSMLWQRTFFDWLDKYL